MKLSTISRLISVIVLQLLLTPPVAFSAAIGEGIEAGFPPGAGGSSGRLVVGDDLQFECRAFGVIEGLAVRLFCPLVADDSLGLVACFEDCRKPACASAASLEACRRDAPELANAECRIDKQPSGTAGLSNVVVTYRFKNVSRRSAGRFACQYKQMRSQYAVSVSEPATTSAPSTTVAPTTTTLRSTPTTNVRITTKKTTAISTSTKSSTKTTRPVQAELIPIVEASSTTTPQLNSGTSKLNTAIQTTSRTVPIGSTRAGAISDSPVVTTGRLNSGWFDTEIIDSLKNGHILIAGLILVLLVAITLTVSLVCWKRCFNSPDGDSRHNRGGYRLPPLGRASGRGSMDDADTADLLLLQQRYRPPPPQRPLSRSRSGSRPGSAHSFVSSPIYNEPDVAASAAAAARMGDSIASSDYYARPSPAAPPPGGGFFSRSQDGRHSFHSVGQSNRQHRIGGGGGVGNGSSELLSGGRGNHGDGPTVGINVGAGASCCGPADSDQHTVREMFRLLTEQGRELQHLTKQVRASQQALSRLAASYQDLHRSVSLSRVRHPSSSPRNSPLDGRQFNSQAASSAAATPDSIEDPYDDEVSGLLPSAAQISAATESMTAEAAALGGDADSPVGDADSTDGLASSASGRVSAAASGLGVVETINEELESDEATLRPKKQQQHQQQQQLQK